MDVEENSLTKKDYSFVLTELEFLEQIDLLKFEEHPGQFIGGVKVPTSQDTNTQRQGETVIVGGNSGSADKIYARDCLNQMNLKKRIGGSPAFLATEAL